MNRAGRLCAAPGEGSEGERRPMSSVSRCSYTNLHLRRSQILKKHFALLFYLVCRRLRGHDKREVNNVTAAKVRRVGTIHGV